jgi:hypothetical protein
VLLRWWEDPGGETLTRWRTGGSSGFAAMPELCLGLSTTVLPAFT